MRKRPQELQAKKSCAESAPPRMKASSPLLTCSHPGRDSQKNLSCGPSSIIDVIMQTPTPVFVVILRMSGQLIIDELDFHSFLG
jgi:hypothetical protein